MSSSAAAKSSVIYADDSDFNFDPGQGGVRLASESALCLSGKVSKGCKASPDQFTRYTKVTPIDESEMKATLLQQSAELIAVGDGKELYKDPVSGTEQVIQLGPIEAVTDLLATLRTSGKGIDDTMDIIVNLVGGDDTQVLEVLGALGQLREGMGISQKAKMSFFSLTHPSFPLQRVTMTLVAMPSDVSTNSIRESKEKAIAQGLVFFQEGKYYTLLEDHINSDLI
eukprot:CAMPEP_0198143086 /NCGR_PEP_ID=MMETSP1443-20131203/5729_1 /TAXON_ID=186043 /ORGANISM="Entomoneis sp., Strain CCMP2396" /LENGTH=225 /DNA_ID=CAMNT_0043806227 /DNA_START=319 /DNA_END=996 /DNA_ORIENTATION=+